MTPNSIAPFKKYSQLFSLYLFAESTHEAESYVLQAALENEGFDFVPYSCEVK